MTAAVVFYMFLNSFAPIVINDNFLTTIVFDEEIENVHTGANAKQLYLHKDANSKMLFIKSLGSNFETNLTVPTKSGKLYSFLIKTGKKPHSVIQVKDGRKTAISREIVNSNTYNISDSDFITTVKNKTKSYLTINSVNIPPLQSYEVPKGAPIFINNKRVYR